MSLDKLFEGKKTKLWLLNYLKTKFFKSQKPTKHKKTEV